MRKPRRERKIMREILPLAVICTTLNTRIKNYGNTLIHSYTFILDWKSGNESLYTCKGLVTTSFPEYQFNMKLDLLE